MANQGSIEEELVCMISIINRADTDKIMEIFLNESVRFNFSTIARGTATDEILDFLKISKSEKAVIFTVLKLSISKKIQKRLLEECHMNKPGHGISFVIPILKVGGVKFTIKNKDCCEKRGDYVEEIYKYELIIAICNRGFAEDVTDAARTVTPSIGGTIMHGRGLGFKEVEKFLGITISPEKEILMILVNKEESTKIMKAILQEAGPHKESRAITFSLPVTEAIGMSTLS